jgi:hypothetical protein
MRSIYRFGAVCLSTLFLLPTVVWAVSQQDRFEARLATVDALLPAISANDPHYQSIADLRRRAQELFATRMDDGEAMLEQAYQLLKLAIRDLRGGTTPLADRSVADTHSSDSSLERRYQGRKATVGILLAALQDGGAVFDSAAAGCERADDDYNRGELQSAMSAIDQCYSLLREAVVKQRFDDTQIVSDSGGSDSARSKELYRSLERSVEALSSAYEEITAEQPDGNSLLASNIATQQKLAQEHLVAGEMHEAMNRLKASYQLLKVALVDRRQGATLVRSLQFERPEDEYHYELDRLATYQMLYRLLLSSKGKAVDEGLFSASNDLRKTAADMAGSQQWKDAIHTLELATDELKKGIRRAGFLLPG